MGSINLGSKIYLISGQKYNPIGGDSKLQFWVGKDAELRIGDRVGISNTSIVAFEKIIIEDDVLIGGGCKIYDTDFHPLESKNRIIGHPNSFKSNKKEVRICKGVFIGGHSIILKGVTIGNNSIIGAGSVVSKNIPPNEIWGGNPAIFIKRIESD
ncbi:MAG: acyltransferase [Ignavibacteriae bacterium]|nr:acyltransferase [Ignavibacteriota bacterium]